MTVTYNNNDYELRLNARGCVELEKKLGTNPVNTLIKFSENNEIPSFITLFAIVQSALPKGQSAETLYDDMCADGYGFEKLMELIVDIFKDAGLIPEGALEEDADGKN